MPNYNISQGKLFNGAKIDSNNFVSLIGGSNNGYVEILVNVQDAGEYSINISYLSQDINRIFKLDINGINTGIIYNTIKTNGNTILDAKKINLKVNLNSGNNTIRFYGDSLDYAPSLGSFDLEILASDIVTFLDTNNKEIAKAELNIDSRNLTVKINDNETYLRWGNLLGFDKINKDNYISQNTLPTSSTLPTSVFSTGVKIDLITPSNGAKIESITGIINGIGGTTDGAATLNITASEAGKYNMELSYRNLDSKNKVITLDINGVNTGIKYSIPTDINGKFNILIQLNIGSNIIKIHGDGINLAPSLVNFIFSKKVMSDYDLLKNLLLGPEEVNVVFVGDSITHGAAHTKGYRSFLEHFNERIRGEYVGQYLKKNNFIINTGVSSAVSTDILNYFDRRVYIYNPRVVIILIGMNDCSNNKVPLTEYISNIKTIIAKIRGIGAIPVLQTSNTIKPVGTRASLSQYMDAIRTISISEEIPLIDHYKYWTEQQAIDATIQSKWLSDAIHPNARGHLVMAKKIFEYLGLIDVNSYTYNMSYPIQIAGDLGKYVDTLIYPEYTGISNSTLLISYKINRQFMGSEYIDRTEDLNKLKTLTKGTIVARFNITTSDNAQTIFSISDSKVDASNATLAINSGAIHFSIRNDGIFSTNITTSKKGYNDGVWHTVVVDVNSTGTNIYIDGINIYTDTTSKGFFNSVTSANTVNIGRNFDFKPAGEWYYKGAVSYINIYDKNLTQEQSIAISNENMVNNSIDISNIIASNDLGAWVFVGDNVTAGKSTTYGYRNYVEHVEERIRWELNNSIMTRREKFMINMASKDITSVEILNNFNNLIGRYNPKVVFLMVGGNEKVSSIEFKNNLNNIISKIKILNSIIVLQTPVFNGKNISDYISVIKEIANSQKIVLINHYDYWFNLQQTQPQLISSWLKSNLEPNHRGHLEIAKKILKDLNIFDTNSVTCSFNINTPGDNLSLLKSEISTKIKEAYSLYNNFIEGTLKGQFKIGAKKELLNTINQSEKFQNNNIVDIIVLTQCKRNLQMAIDEFKTKKI